MPPIHRRGQVVNTFGRATRDYLFTAHLSGLFPRIDNQQIPTAPVTLVRQRGGGSSQQNGQKQQNMSWPETRHDKTNTKQFKRFWLGRETEFRLECDRLETDMSNLAQDSVFQIRRVFLQRGQLNRRKLWKRGDLLLLLPISKYLIDILLLNNLLLILSLLLWDLSLRFTHFPTYLLNP